MSHAILAEGLVKRFGDTTALAGVDLALPTGSVLGLLGPNGAGKTTAVRILATLTSPDAGTATVAGHDLLREPHLVRTQIGLTGQYAAVDESLTGAENLLLIGRLLGLSRAAAKRRAAELLADFRLEDAGGRAARTYSGGMRRRLDLAASLVGDPRLLYLDEPTTGLDPRSRNELWDIVRRLVSDGASVLLTTQYLDEADQLADDIVVIDHGRVIATGTPDELKSRAGAQTLVVRPVKATDVPALAVEVSALIGRPAAVSGDVVSATVSDSELLPALVRQLDAAGVHVAELSLRSPSLDEVFLSLTGRPTNDETTEVTA
ncbi:ATP-binding cassette domain-containing protein [Pilimelia columellifera]|uniref:Daunorubicin resistance protein DrrA family ABC transporter ATP-binding protein n=1 Tax=Pilimelia columellifera subsp. columellifera TaxID=706583 RepID=A0ABN3NGX3_9ACTN